MKAVIFIGVLLGANISHAMNGSFHTTVGGNSSWSVSVSSGRGGYSTAAMAYAAEMRRRLEQRALLQAQARQRAVELEQGIAQTKQAIATQRKAESDRLPQDKELLNLSHVQLSLENPEKEQTTANMIERMKKKLQKAPIGEVLCFPAETLVSVKHESGYQSQPISTVQVGDYVVSCNLAVYGGSCEFGRVKTKMTRIANKLVQLRYEDQLLRTTENHPFFVMERDDWVEAQDLRVGEHLLDISGKEIALEDKQTEETTGTVVYNLEVEGDYQSYYACDVLVHNCALATQVAENAPTVLSGMMPVAIPVQLPSLQEIRDRDQRLGNTQSPIQTVNPNDTIIERIPRTDGTWSGIPGESQWTSTNKDVIGITQGTPVPFKDQYPDFSQWVKKRYEFGDLNGENSHDFGLADKKLAEELGIPNQKAAKDYRKKEKLTWHHHQDGKTLELVPTKLHKNIPHDGGASELREKQ